MNIKTLEDIKELVKESLRVFGVPQDPAECTVEQIAKVSLLMRVMNDCGAAVNQFGMENSDILDVMREIVRIHEKMDQAVIALTDIVKNAENN